MKCIEWKGMEFSEVPNGWQRLIQSTILYGIKVILYNIIYNILVMLLYKGEPLVPNTAESGSEQFLPNFFEHCDHINLNTYIHSLHEIYNAKSLVSPLWNEG